MNFEQILKELLNGKKIKRSCWENNHYWHLVDNQLVNSNNEKPKINKSQLKADDWEVFKDFKNPRDEEWLKMIKDVFMEDKFIYSEDILKELKRRMGY